jgi:hypothetical protein
VRREDEHDPRVMAIADGFVRLDHGRVVP